MPEKTSTVIPVGIVGRLVGSADSWSGIPEGLASGFRELGFAPFFLSAEPSPGVDRLLQRWLSLSGRMDTSWAQTPEMILLRSALVRLRRIAKKSRSDTRHWVQMGSEFGHPVRGFVTFEDMTVALASRLPDYVPLRPPVARAWIRRQRAIYARAEACCVASHWAADGLSEYGVERSKVHVVGFGCNIRVEVRERDWSVPRFLFIGLDWERKNGPAVMEAFEHVHEECPDARLDLVGSHPQIDRPGVRCHGRLRLDVPSERACLEDLLRAATCLVLPSRYEPFGIVYAEAGWAGVPSIGTVVGGAADAIGSGGIVVDPQSSAQLRKAMLTMCNATTAAELGAKARSHSQLLSWDAVSRRIATVMGLTVGETVADLPRGTPLGAVAL